MRHWEWLTPVALLIGLACIVIAVLSAGGTSAAADFMNVTSIFIVFGGLFAALAIHFQPKDLKKTGRILKQAFVKQELHKTETVDWLVVLSKKARRDGILSLEKEAQQAEDPFLRKGLMYVADGLDASEIQNTLAKDIRSLQERHRRGRMIFQKAGDLAPSWGMIGTLIGLVMMLQTLNEPSQLGPKMAVALLTTLYGVLLSNLFFHPIAGKLEAKTNEEVFMKQVILEGILGIQSGENWRVLQEELYVHFKDEDLSEEDASWTSGVFSNEI